VTEIPLRQSPPLKISQDRSIRIEKSSEIPSFQFDHPISILDQTGLCVATITSWPVSGASERSGFSAGLLAVSHAVKQ
jgi:hypothetical protein